MFANPAVPESLGLQSIPVEEGGTSSQVAASETLGVASVKGPTAAPLVKKGPCITIRESRLPKRRERPPLSLSNLSSWPRDFPLCQPNCSARSAGGNLSTWQSFSAIISQQSSGEVPQWTRVGSCHGRVCPCPGQACGAAAAAVSPACRPRALAVTLAPAWGQSGVDT